MKVYQIALFVLLFPLLFGSTCKHEENLPFVIRNNSTDRIFVLVSLYGTPISQDTVCLRPTSSQEYEKLIHSDNVISPASESRFDQIREFMAVHPNDTIYIGVFKLDDIVSMPCEEFIQQFPLKKEWGLSLEEMEGLDWILEY